MLHAIQKGSVQDGGGAVQDGGGSVQDGGGSVQDGGGSVLDRGGLRALGALTQMCPPFRLRPSICLGVIGGMLTQHEVCLDVSVDTTLGYRLPASCKLALLFF